MGNTHSSQHQYLYITKVTNRDLPLCPFIHAIVSSNLSNGQDIVDPTILKKLLSEKDLVLEIVDIRNNSKFKITIPKNTEKLGMTVVKVAKLPSILNIRVVAVRESSMASLIEKDQIIGIVDMFCEDEDELIYNVKTTEFCQLVVLRDSEVEIIDVESNDLGCEIGTGILYKPDNKEYTMKEYNGKIVKCYENVQVDSIEDGATHTNLLQEEFNAGNSINISEENKEELKNVNIPYSNYLNNNIVGFSDISNQSKLEAANLDENLKEKNNLDEQTQDNLNTLDSIRQDFQKSCNLVDKSNNGNSNLIKDHTEFNNQSSINSSTITNQQQPCELMDSQKSGSLEIETIRDQNPIHDSLFSTGSDMPHSQEEVPQNSQEIPLPYIPSSKESQVSRISNMDRTGSYIYKPSKKSVETVESPVQSNHNKICEEAGVPDESQFVQGSDVLNKESASLVGDKFMTKDHFIDKNGQQRMKDDIFSGVQAQSSDIKDLFDDNNNEDFIFDTKKEYKDI